MAAKKKAATAAAPKKSAAKEPKAKEPIAGGYPIGADARREDETDSEFAARREAEWPKGVHDPIRNVCPECGSVPAQQFEIKQQDDEGNVTTFHAQPGKPLAYQAMLAHYKELHPDAAVPRHAQDEDVPDPDHLAALLDRSRDADGKVVDDKRKPAEFAA